ncbi:hypothetical protein QYE76_055457 [Lolium multiflorum]|uniref:Maternal effect embryo arrest 22 n=1 Tax=Lolium multiflorum TaxID=4521 RepID=A0AAD8SZQ7_LOLMU|nr:hypothetical protein QYE76_055450 [Lolium multiflorum]KAK1667298.1 hypothetical protein QYE76_055457 [Lolium multiflorum]
MAAEAAESESSQEPPALAAAASAPAGGGPNPCCAKLWKKYQQAEKGRAALRQGVNLLNGEVQKLQNEISTLNQVCKEQRLRADSAQAAKETESDARDLLEKEVIELKAKNSALHFTQNVSKNDNELLRISELEEENRRLKQVLGEERLKMDSEKKKVEEAKRKTSDAQNLLKAETKKSEEFKRLADLERKAASDLKVSCEKLRIEANETRSQLSAQIQKTGEAYKKAEAEKQKTAREKKCADSEKMLAEKNKKLIEVERKKVMEEKSRSGHLFAQLEEQKKLNENLHVSIEAQRKNVMCEKNRADQLLQKLEEERKRCEYLQRKTDDFGSARDRVSFGNDGIQRVDGAIESANIKLLKEKLKRKKDQLKHVKRESKLDRALIRKELQLLKRDWMQPLSQFNRLDDYLAGGAEDVRALKRLKRQPKVHGLEHRQHALLPHNQVPAPYFGLQAGMVPFTSSPREYASYQLPRESCTRPISGTRKNQSSTTPELPPTNCSTRKQDDTALLDISGHFSRREASKPSFPGGIEVADQTLKGGRKRKRTKNTVESLPRDATTNDNLAFNDDRSCLQQRNNAMPCMSKDGLQNNGRKGPGVIDRSFSGCAKGPSPGAGNAFEGSKFDSLFSFEKLIKGDCLKLLDLDNDADEEKYRKAMEAPLSPDVPVVLPTKTKSRRSPDLVVGNNDGYDTECPASRSDVNLSEVQNFSQNGKFQSSTYSRTEHGGSVMELYANGKSTAAANVSYSAKLIDTSGTASLSCLSHRNEASNAVLSLAVESDSTMGPQFSGNADAILHLCNEVPNKSRQNQICTASSDPVPQNNIGLSKAQTAQTINLTSDGLSGHCQGAGNNSLNFVGVTSLKRSSIVNIMQYWEALTSETSKLSQDVFVDGSLLERVSTEPLLLPEERIPLIFSLFLWGVRKLTSDPVVDQYSALSAFSMTVKPYMETRLAFLKSSQLDVLVSLIEDFLMNKEVVVCDKMGVMNSDGSKHCHLDDEIGMQLSTKPATRDQFISACILLASVCAKVERVDIVLEVSYRVLQMGKANLSWTMSALHVFGFVCGDKLLLVKSCNLLMTTIRLVVLLLESSDTSLCLVSSHIQSSRQTAFPSCTHCLFDVDTVSIDVFISSLLDELDLCALSGINHVKSNEAITKHSPHLGSSALQIDCGEPCNIHKQAKVAEGINYPAGRDLCYYTEIISLLELFGSYMSCEWTYKNVVLRLLKILESCPCEEYSAALFVLVSQLGRFFIDDVGYEMKTVIELRNKLSVLMGTSFTTSKSILVQFSAVGALLSLLPLTFDKIVASPTGPLSGLCVLQATQISEWFAQLSKENQSFACSFFS